MPLRQRFDDTTATALITHGSALDAADAAMLIDRGEDAMTRGGLVVARLIFQKVMDAGYVEGAFNLARSFDPRVLSALPVHIADADEEKAKMLYAFAGSLLTTIAPLQ